MAVAFGKEMMKSFTIDSTCTFINHGSFGTTPKSVLDYRISLIRQMESQPDFWFRGGSDPMWADNIKAVGKFLGAKPENLIFVTNTTTAINAFIRSMKFSEDDGVLLYSWNYYAIRNVCRYISDSRGLKIYYADIPLPLEGVTQFLDKYEEMLVLHPNIKVVIIDYISSLPNLLLPVPELIALCKKYNKLVVVDGAHAPGQIQLNLETLGADFFAVNLNKWAYAPLGCAVFWIHPDFHGKVFPVVTSHYHPEAMEPNYTYQGTQDMTAFFCAKKALKFYKSVGGHEVISEYSTSLVTRAADMLVKKWNTEHFPIPMEMRAPFMRMVRIPLLKRYPPIQVAQDDMLSKSIDMKTLTLDMWLQFKIQANFVSVDNKPWVRISANIYNVFSDYEKLADAILVLEAEDQLKSMNGVNHV